MQPTLDTVQPEQWSWMVTQLWSWVWSGMSWILELQQILFGFLFSGSTGMIVLKSILLLLPVAILIVDLQRRIVELVRNAKLSQRRPERADDQFA